MLYKYNNIWKNIDIFLKIILIFFILINIELYIYIIFYFLLIINNILKIKYEKIYY